MVDAAWALANEGVGEVTDTIISIADCESLPVGSIVHSAWCLAGWRQYAVKTPDGWIMLDSFKTKGLQREYGEGWFVDWVPE